MTRRIIITALALFAVTTLAMAQNSIDRMVADYSSVGSSRFTSAIERDPDTRKIEKVVKVLEINYKGIDKFISAFKEEAGKGNFSEKYDNDGCTMMLTTSTKTQNRIYMMRCEGPMSSDRRYNRYHNAKITIIVKYK